ncbi:hypothetical protein [Candidatus Hodgkinia cicadicola]|uniref:hypothetical protein n=1 Tax=Candidatus Hodgkinia cicadicola TaxID=573658 RepID=UPI001788AC9C
MLIKPICHNVVTKYLNMLTMISILINWTNLLFDINILSLIYNNLQPLKAIHEV